MKPFAIEALKLHVAGLWLHGTVSPYPYTPKNLECRNYLKQSSTGLVRRPTIQFLSTLLTASGVLRIPPPNYSWSHFFCWSGHHGFWIRHYLYWIRSLTVNLFLGGWVARGAEEQAGEGGISDIRGCLAMVPGSWLMKTFFIFFDFFYIFYWHIVANELILIMVNEINHLSLIVNFQ